MTRPHARIDPALRSQIDSVVARYADARRTFTEEEAFSAIWEAGYDASPQDDPRFCLAREADGRNPRHWCLAGHTLATSQLVEALRSETWDGKDLDEQLALLDHQHGGHHVYCPVDHQLYFHPDGRLELADEEREDEIPEEVRSVLLGHADALLERWRQAGSAPWTTRQVTEQFAEAGWEAGKSRGAWLQVRVWLRTWASVSRVGQDFWVPADALPAGPSRTRMSVVRIRDASGPARLEVEPGVSSREEAAEGPWHDRPVSMSAPSIGWATGGTARWIAVLRTVNLVEGFLSVPASARAAYPAPTRDASRWEVVRGRWFETGESLWVWLDRERNLLCGPDLVERLAWREAGERFEIVWSPESLVLRPDRIDAEAQREETRLADADNLASLRGGLGESYRTSIAAILSEAPKGLTCREIVEAVSLRQGHQVHGGTIRTILHAGGFVYRDGRWFTGDEAGRGPGILREAIVVAICEKPSIKPASQSSRERLRGLANSILGRLKEVRKQATR